MSRVPSGKSRASRFRERVPATAARQVHGRADPATTASLQRRVAGPALILGGVGLLALLVRLAYLAEVGASPLVAGLMGDGRVYDAWAQRIAGGEWVGTEVFYQAPLYPYFLAVLFKVAGHDLGLVRFVQAVLAGASCVLLGLAGRRFFSDRAGIFAALLLAFYPAALFFDGLIQKSALDTFLITLILALLAAFLGTRRLSWLAALGLATAAFVLNRENGRVLYPVVGGWLLLGFRDVSLRKRLAWTTAFAAASLAILLPVGLRNYRIGGEFLLSTSQLGPNFYIGNNPHASGSYEPLIPERADAIYEREDATRLASEAAGRPLTPGEVSSYWLDRSLAYIKAQPLHWLQLSGKKLLLTLNASELPDTESIELYSDYSAILRVLLWMDFGVILPLAAFGAWLNRGQWRRLLILYAAVVALALSVAAFYVLARYRHPMVPIVLLFSAAGVEGLMNLRRPERVAGWRAGAALAVTVAILANLPFHVVRDQSYLNLGSLLVQNGRHAEGIPLLRKAVSVEPEYAEPHFRLGLAYRDAGQNDFAIQELTATVRLRPDDADAHNALGMLLHGQGRLHEALPHFREAVRVAPASFEARANLAVALSAAGEYGASFEHYREAIRLEPDHFDVHVNYATALCAAGDAAGCIEQYEAAARLAPDPDTARRITEAIRQSGLRPARQSNK